MSSAPTYFFEEISKKKQSNCSIMFICSKSFKIYQIQSFERCLIRFTDRIRFSRNFHDFLRFFQSSYESFTNVFKNLKDWHIFNPSVTRSALQVVCERFNLCNSLVFHNFGTVFHDILNDCKRVDLIREKRCYRRGSLMVNRQEFINQII